MLAAAGLLDGRRAATHGARAAELAAGFPQVQVDPGVLYVDHGDVATSAGSAAGVDLCLHLVRTDHGAAHALRIARQMVMPPHREGCQLQYAELATSGPVADSLAPCWNGWPGAWTSRSASPRWRSAPRSRPAR